MTTPTHDPTPAQDPPQPVDHQRDVDVTTGDGRSGVMTAVVATVAVLALLLFGWLAFGGDETVDAGDPADVDVTVEDGDQSTTEGSTTTETEG